MSLESKATDNQNNLTFCKCMSDAGDLCTKYPDKTKKRKNCMNFVVPYTVDGVDQYKCYIHIRENDVPRPELLFAKYMRGHPEVAKEYGELKQKLALECGDNRQEYMMAKTEFVETYTRLAEKRGRYDMKKTKIMIFVVALLCNAAFLLLCGYGQIHHEETATYWDPALGVVAVLVLAWGDTSIAVQLYFRNKYRHLKRRSFDWKFRRQCLLLAIYYIGSLWYLSAMTFDFMVSYLSLFAIALSPLWLLGGSRTLWWSENGEEAYYLDDRKRWYLVRDVTENEYVVELKCTAPGDRDRTITIEKKKQWR